MERKLAYSPLAEIGTDEDIVRIRVVLIHRPDEERFFVVHEDESTETWLQSTPFGYDIFAMKGSTLEAAFVAAIDEYCDWFNKLKPWFVNGDSFSVFGPDVEEVAA
jgi:hypothetical protein